MLLATASIPDVITFVLAAAIVIGGALGVVFGRNPVHCALMLVMTLFGIAVLFVEEDAQFLAAVQVIVYAGAIVVLFLFVIMLLGVDRTEALRSDPHRAQRGWAILLGAGVLAEIILLGSGHWTTGASSVAGKLEGQGPNVNVLGKALFTTYLLPFEVTSALLVVAVVAAVVLARRHETSGPAEPEIGEIEATELRAAHAEVDEHDADEHGVSEQGADGHEVDEHEARAMTIPVSYYLTLAAILFTIGAVGLLVRRNVLVMFMCIELMLNAVNLTFVSFARELNDLAGQVAVFFILVVAAAEVVVGLGIIVAIFRRRPGATADDAHVLKG